MILIDINQLMIANILKNLQDAEEPENLIRHKILKNILSIKKNFGKEFGDIVICCDSRSYWRRDFFPPYKAHRKEARESSGFDWDKIHNFFDIFKNEIKAFLPYVMIEISGAEADDVIGTLTKAYHTKEKILIFSSDKDFLQLQKYPNVFQYSSIKKEFISVNDPVLFLKEHIIIGDKGDGIPNIQNDDDVYISTKKQNRIYKKNIEKWIQMEPVLFCTETMLKRYERNKILIDLDNTPKDIEKQILNDYENYKPNPKNKMLTYFIQNGLKKLTNNLTEF